MTDMAVKVPSMQHRWFGTRCFVWDDDENPCMWHKLEIGAHYYKHATFKAVGRRIWYVQVFQNMSTGHYERVLEYISHDALKWKRYR